MEQTIQIVLGALGGSLITLVIYSYLEVLKMRKTIQEHNQEIKSIRVDLDNAINSLNERITREWDAQEISRHSSHNALRRDFDNAIEETHRTMAINNSEAHTRMDDLNRYVDSRIDKTIDVLCARMDAKPTKKAKAPKEEMLNS